MAPGKAPVDAVGGTQESGPWPEEVDEIVEGDQHEREVEVLKEIRCSKDGQTFGDIQSARDHIDANHGGDYSLIETETGTEFRTVTVTEVRQLTDRPDVDPEDEAFAVNIQFDRSPGGGA